MCRSLGQSDDSGQQDSQKQHNGYVYAHHSGDQHGHIGHQLQKSDALQAVEHPAGEGAVFIPQRLPAVPLTEPGGKKQDDCNFGNLRGLELHAQVQPPAGAVVFPAQRSKDQQQKNDAENQGRHRHPPEGLVVDLGDHIHHCHAHRSKHGLALDVIQGVGHLAVIVSRGIGGREHHNQADAQQDHHQHQKGQIHGPEGQLLFYRQVAFGFSGHGIPPLRWGEG